MNNLQPGLNRLVSKKVPSMSVDSPRSPLAAGLWFLVALTSAVLLGQHAASGTLATRYPVLVAGGFGLLLGAIGVVRWASKRSRGGWGVSHRDVAFAASFSIVVTLGICTLF